MINTENNWVVIDGQNLHKGVKNEGWKIDWKIFREYLRHKYNVVKAVVFMGYLMENKSLYSYMRQAGFILEFRPVKRLNNGRIDGGNIDADLAAFVMDHKQDYHQAIIISGDGDFFKTVVSLNRQNKLKLIISPHLIKNTSQLIKRAVEPHQIISIHSLRNQIEEIQQRAQLLN